MLRLRSLSIQAFRGVSTNITLDLSAPITLIYAPNGVGKTSICDAAEWLLTGTVKRLGDGDLFSELRCAFSDEALETKVQGHLQVGNESIVAERSFSGCSWRLDQGSSRFVTLSEFLEKLAPSAVENGVHPRHANDSRQRWLRGNRFLSGDTLAVLLDTDSSSLEYRERIFADLLGVGHLLETERQVEAYVRELSPFIRSQMNLFDNRSAELRSRQSALEQRDQNAKEDLRPAAMSKVLEACTLLQIPSSAILLPPAPSDFESLQLWLRAELERRGAALRERRRAEVELSAAWSSREAIERQVQDDRRRSVALIGTKQANIDKINALMLRHQTLGREEEIFRSSVSRDRDSGARLRATFERVEPLLGDYVRAIGAGVVTASMASQLIAEAGDEVRRFGQINNLRLLNEERPIQRHRVEELRVLRNELSTSISNVLSPDAVAALQRESRELKGRVLELRRRYEEVAGSAGELKRLAASMIELLGHGSECPTCRHDWGSSEALKQAITTATASLPTSFATLAKDVQYAEVELRAKETELEKASVATERARVVRDQINSLVTSVSAFEEKGKALGLDVQDANFDRSLELSLLRLNLVGGLARLYSDAPVRAKIDDFESVQQTVGIALDSLARSMAVNEGALAEVTKLRESIARELTQLKEEQQVVAAELDALNRQIEGNSAQLQQLRSMWETFCPGKEWGEDEYKRTGAELVLEAKRLADAELQLAQAERLMQTWSDLEEVQRLQLALVPIEAEMERLNGLSSAADDIQRSYRALRHRHVRQQMETFVRVISALFVRMQATEVYDKIMEGDETAPLSWRAVSGGLALDPDRKFSQGQKQDFALAVFLARARGLQGTFFLDEPLVHLDDLNRVALLDVLRAISLESKGDLSIVLTTASKAVVRHFLEKFARIDASSVDAKGQKRKESYLRVLTLSGNPKAGIAAVAG